MNETQEGGGGRDAPAPAPAGEQEAGRGAMGGAIPFVTMALAILLALMVNYLAARHYRRMDWTWEKYYTLSSKTVAVLRALKEPVEVTAFISAGSGVSSDLKDILARYRAVAPKLKVEFVDPDLDAARFTLLQKRYNIRSGKLPDGTQVTEQVVVLKRGAQVKFVAVEEMSDFEPDASGYSTTTSFNNYKAEEQLTSAILGITEAEAVKVCFVTGHGEWSVDRFDERGIGHLGELLTRDNYASESFALADKAQVPAGCRLLVIAGPERPFPEADAEKVDRFFAGGGNLLLFLDPIIDGARIVPGGLEKVLRRAGIDARAAVVVESDAKRLLAGGGTGLETFVTVDYGDHPVTRIFKEIAPPLPTLMRIALPLSAAAGGAAGAAALLSTSAQSWGETDLDGLSAGKEPEKQEGDVAGPLAVAYAATLPAAADGADGDGKEKKEGKKGEAAAKGRLVLFGDSDMLYAELFGEMNLVNQEVVLSALAWLTQRPALVSIPPKNPEKIRLSLTESQVRTVMLWVLVNIPLIVIIAGVLVWWRRRR